MTLAAGDCVLPIVHFFKVFQGIIRVGELLLGEFRAIAEYGCRGFRYINQTVAPLGIVTDCPYLPAQRFSRLLLGYTGHPLQRIHPCAACG